MGDLGSIPGSGRSPWRRKWPPTPVLLPGKSHGWKSVGGYVQSTGSQRVGHDWETSLSLSFPGGPSGKEPACSRGKTRRFDPWGGKIPWRRAWQPTPVFLPGKSHGQGLVGYSPKGLKESDTTERLCTQTQQLCEKIHIKAEHSDWHTLRTCSVLVLPKSGQNHNLLARWSITCLACWE